MVALRKFRHRYFDRWLATLSAPVAAEIADGIDYLCDDGDLTPEEWLDSIAEEGGHDQPWTHPAPEFQALLKQSRSLRRAEHEIVISLAALRRAAGLNQTELAQQWGHGQPHVSKIENDPTHVELATLAGYVRALGGRLTITVEAGGHIYYEDLVGS